MRSEKVFDTEWSGVEWSGVAEEGRRVELGC